jgi:hypothetical protein
MRLAVCDKYMMIARSQVLLGAALLALAGCATTQPMVDVSGKDVDVSALAGRWEGTYTGRDSGRVGTVTFDLVAGYKSAEGKIMMGAVNDPAHARELAIKFVAVEGHQVSGGIGPYADPTCSCSVETRFVGAITGNRIDGTFSTKPVGSDKSAEGTWTVTRK